MENKESFNARLAPYFPPSVQLKIRLAYVLAKFGHRSQVRKQIVDGKPQRYFEHPRRVCILLMDEMGIMDANMICAAILHDVKEDVEDYSSELLEYSFGTEVTQMIICLSKVPKEGYHERLSQCSDWKVLAIKACDRLDNLRSLDDTSLEFRKRQTKETKEIYYPLFDKLVRMAPEAYRINIAKVRDEIHRVTERCCVLIELEEKNGSKERAEILLKEMKSAPEMWASCRESFVNRALTILEMTGIKDETFFQECLTLSGMSTNESFKFIYNAVEKSWAIRVIDKALFILNQNG